MNFRYPWRLVGWMNKVRRARHYSRARRAIIDREHIAWARDLAEQYCYPTGRDNVPTLGQIAKVLSDWKKVGVTYESLIWVANEQVYPEQHHAC